MSQHKASLRKSMQSALAHKRLANSILDSLKESQQQMNAMLDKLDADTAAALDTDYEASLAISSPFEGDGEGSDVQHKASLRQSLRSALAHKNLADEIIDAMEELQVAQNAMLVKLDAQLGVLADVDWVSSLGISSIDPESSLSGQHKASMRKSLQSAMAHRRLANELLDGIKAAQDAMNASLAQLDLGNVAGAHAALKVSEIDPDA